MSYREIGIQVHELGTWVQSVESFTARVEDLALDPQCPRKKPGKVCTYNIRAGEGGNTQVPRIPWPSSMDKSPSMSSMRDSALKNKSPSIFLWLLQICAYAHGG